MSAATQTQMAKPLTIKCHKATANRNPNAIIHIWNGRVQRGPKPRSAADIRTAKKVERLTRILRLFELHEQEKREAEAAAAANGDEADDEDEEETRVVMVEVDVDMRDVVETTEKWLDNLPVRRGGCARC